MDSSGNKKFLVRKFLQILQVQVTPTCPTNFSLTNLTHQKEPWLHHPALFYFLRVEKVCGYFSPKGEKYPHTFSPFGKKKEPGAVETSPCFDVAIRATAHF